MKFSIIELMTIYEIVKQQLNSYDSEKRNYESIVSDGEKLSSWQETCYEDICMKCKPLISIIEKLEKVTI